MIDSLLFSIFLRIQKPPTDTTDPIDKKEGYEIDSFKGNLSKNVKLKKYSAKSIVFQVF